MAEETKPLLVQEQKEESDDLTSPSDLSIHQFRLPESFPVSRARLLSSVVLLLYMAAFVGSVPLQSQYVYIRLHPEYFNRTDNNTPIANSCITSNNDPRLRAEAALQARVAETLLFFTLASTGPMLVAVFVFGSYSDVLGRKFLFIFPTLTALVVGMLSQTPLPVTRSILSKMAGPSKQGALFASVAVVDTVCTLLSVASYSTVYQATVARMRGAVFLFMSSLVFLNFLLVLAFKRVTRGGSLLPEPELQAVN